MKHRNRFGKLLGSWLFLLPLLLPAQQNNSDALLWRLSKKGMPDSYVLGTAHFACEAQFLSSPFVLEKLQSAKTLYLELALDDPSLTGKMMKAMALDTTRLSRLMGERFAAADSSFQSLTGLSLKALDGFHPFVALGWLVQKTLPCVAPVQMETVLLQAAQKAQIPTRGLESIEEQLAAVLSLPLREQVEELEKGLRQPGRLREEMKSLQQVYLSQSTQALFQLVQTGTGLSGGDAALLTNRNINWVEKAKLFLPKAPAFLAVGAAHLGGPSGILQLLRNNGWQTTPLPLP